MDTMKIKTQSFKIIGGGIAGLASALAVANAGSAAKIFEKTKQFETVGAGLQLGPNAARALQKLGAWDAVLPFTYAPPEIHMRDGRTGKLIKRLQLGKAFEARFRMPYLTAHRADLHNALRNVVKTKTNIEIQTNLEVGNLSLEGFDGIIAADGMWSRSREKLFPGTEAIIANDTYFRSLLPMPTSSNDVAFDCVNLWLYPAGHVVHYPAGHPVQLNLIAITNGIEPKTFFRQAHQNLRNILELPHNFTQWQSAYVSPLKYWNKENVTLIGDAAHGTLPYLAQGAAMALEDAATLAQILKVEKQTPLAFERLCQSRMQRTAKLHKATMRNGTIYHLDGWRKNLVRTALPLMQKDFPLSLNNWIYQWDI